MYTLSNRVGMNLYSTEINAKVFCSKCFRLVRRKCTVNVARCCSFVHISVRVFQLYPGYVYICSQRWLPGAYRILCISLQINRMFYVTTVEVTRDSNLVHNFQY